MTRQTLNAAPNEFGSVSRRRLTVIAVAFSAALLGLVGADDLRHTREQHAHYCAMVAAGHWPAYDGTAGCKREVSQ